MIQLTREVRFSLVPTEKSPLSNSWGGWPSATQIAPWLVLRCTLSGDLDPVTGYLCNIKVIDNALREKVIEPLCRQSQPPSGEAFVQQAADIIKDRFPSNCRVHRLQLCATPTLKYTFDPEVPKMVRVTQQFEFCASHRLHNSDLTEDENRELFGKCNNPHGHGHNYFLDVTVEGEPDSETGTVVSLEALESLVKQQVIDRLDHRNLNVEIDEFNELNPSVENIAKVIWDRLKEPVGALPGSARLHNVCVYETPKTWADYSEPTAPAASE